MCSHVRGPKPVWLKHLLFGLRTELPDVSPRAGHAPMQLSRVVDASSCDANHEPDAWEEGPRPMTAAWLSKVLLAACAMGPNDEVEAFGFDVAHVRMGEGDRLRRLTLRPRSGCRCPTSIFAKDVVAEEVAFYACVAPLLNAGGGGLLLSRQYSHQPSLISTLYIGLRNNPSGCPAGRTMRSRARWQGVGHI